MQELQNQLSCNGLVAKPESPCLQRPWQSCKTCCLSTDRARVGVAKPDACQWSACAMGAMRFVQKIRCVHVGACMHGLTTNSPIKRSLRSLKGFLLSNKPSGLSKIGTRPGSPGNPPRPGSPAPPSLPGFPKAKHSKAKQN